MLGDCIKHSCSKTTSFFFFLVAIYFSKFWLFHNLFKNVPTDGHSPLPQFFIITNNDIKYIHIQDEPVSVSLKLILDIETGGRLWCGLGPHHCAGTMLMFPRVTIREKIQVAEWGRNRRWEFPSYIYSLSTSAKVSYFQSRNLSWISQSRMVSTGSSGRGHSDTCWALCLVAFPRPKGREVFPSLRGNECVHTQTLNLTTEFAYKRSIYMINFAFLRVWLVGPLSFPGKPLSLLLSLFSSSPPPPFVLLPTCRPGVKTWNVSVDSHFRT